MPYSSTPHTTHLSTCTLWATDSLLVYIRPQLCSAPSRRLAETPMTSARDVTGSPAVVDVGTAVIHPRDFSAGRRCRFRFHNLRSKKRMREQNAPAWTGEHPAECNLVLPPPQLDQLLYALSRCRPVYKKHCFHDFTRVPPPHPQTFGQVAPLNPNRTISNITDDLVRIQLFQLFSYFGDNTVAK